MDELLFPGAALMLTFGGGMPMLTLVSYKILRRERATTSWAAFGSETTFAWLVVPTVLPFLWLISSAFHQNEPTRAITACLIHHADVCVDALILLGILLSGLVATLVARAWCEYPRGLPERVERDHPLVQRIKRISGDDPRTNGLDVIVTRCSPEPVYTVGLLRPRVVVDACFARDADDEILRAALLHEHAHIVNFDTLRCFLVRLCFSINPASSLLEDDFAKWRAAREASCDGEAVHRGGKALALAEGILRAARFRCDGLNSAAISSLCGHDTTALKLRVAILLQGPQAPGKTGGHVVLLIATIFAILVPHIEGFDLLEALHVGVERMFHSNS